MALGPWVGGGAGPGGPWTWGSWLKERPGHGAHMQVYESWSQPSGPSFGGEDGHVCVLQCPSIPSSRGSGTSLLLGNKRLMARSLPGLEPPSHLSFPPPTSPVCLLSRVRSPFPSGLSCVCTTAPPLALVSHLTCGALSHYGTWRWCRGDGQWAPPDDLAQGTLVTGRCPSVPSPEVTIVTAGLMFQPHCSRRPPAR